MKAQCCAHDLFETGRVKDRDNFFPLDLLNVHIEQQKYLRDKSTNSENTS